MYLTAQRMLITYATIKHDSSKFFILSANTQPGSFVLLYTE